MHVPVNVILSYIIYDTLVYGTGGVAVARDGDTRAPTAIPLRQIEGSSGSQICSETATPDYSQTVPPTRDNRC